MITRIDESVFLIPLFQNDVIINHSKRNFGQVSIYGYVFDKIKHGCANAFMPELRKDDDIIQLDRIIFQHNRSKGDDAIIYFIYVHFRSGKVFLRQYIQR